MHKFYQVYRLTSYHWPKLSKTSHHLNTISPANNTNNNNNTPNDNYYYF